MFPQPSTLNVLTPPKTHLFLPPFNPELTLFQAAQSQKEDQSTMMDDNNNNNSTTTRMSISPPQSSLNTTNDALSAPQNATEQNNTTTTSISQSSIANNNSNEILSSSSSSSSQVVINPTAPPLEDYTIDFNAVLSYKPSTSNATTNIVLPSHPYPLLPNPEHYAQSPFSPKLNNTLEDGNNNLFFSVPSTNWKVNLNDHASTPFIQCHLIATHQLNKILSLAQKKGKIKSFNVITNEIQTEGGPVFQSEVFLDDKSVVKGLPGSSPFEAEGFACRCALDSFSTGSVLCEQLNIKGLLVECCTKMGIALRFETKNLASNGLAMGPFQCTIYAQDKPLATSTPMRSKVLAERCASQEALLHIELPENKPIEMAEITKSTASTTVNYKGSLNEFLSKIGVQQYRCEYVTTSNGVTSGPFQSKFLLDGREICTGVLKATKREAEQSVSDIALKKLIEEYNSRLEQIQPPVGYIKSHVVLTPTDSNKVTNFKGMLFELLNKKNAGKFEFQTKGTKGDTIGPFSCTLLVNGFEIVTSGGHATKRAAEQTVSEIVLKQFGIGTQGESPLESATKDKLTAFCASQGFTLSILVRGTDENDALPLSATVLVDNVVIATTEQKFLSKITCEEVASKSALDILLRKPSNVNNKR